MAAKIKIKGSESQNKNVADLIISSYIEYVLGKGKRPVSVADFTKKINIEEQEFFNLFGSFDSLEKSIWASQVKATLDLLSASKEYQSYPVKEKLLTFYYTLFEVFKENRSFILISAANETELIKNNILSKTREAFKEYVTQLVAEGIESGEIAKRPYITDKYPEGLWMQLLFALRFWIKDDSAGFEKTDAAIEKALKLSFDLMGPGPVDSLVDMAKFLYQNK